LVSSDSLDKGDIILMVDLYMDLIRVGVDIRFVLLSLDLE